MRSNPVEPAREPPVPFAEEFHRCRNQNQPDECRVNSDRHRQTETKLLRDRVGVATKEMKTATMIAAAAVITRAVTARPSATASLVVLPWDQNSRIRLRRKTS